MFYKNSTKTFWSPPKHKISTESEAPFPPTNLFLTAFQASKQNLINLWSSYLQRTGSSMCSGVTSNKRRSKQTSKHGIPLVKQKSDLR